MRLSEFKAQLTDLERQLGPEADPIVKIPYGTRGNVKPITRVELMEGSDEPPEVFIT